MVMFVYREAYSLSRAEPREGTPEHIARQDSATGHALAALPELGGTAPVVADAPLVYDGVRAGTPTAIVLEGALLPGGMPRWDDVLSPAEADALHAYLIDLQGKTRKDELAKVKAGQPLDAPSLAILSNY